MKRARIYIEGNDQSLVLDAAGFVRLRDELGAKALNPCCIECGEKVFLNDEKGALGFRSVNKEITKRGQIQKRPGFSHHKDNANKECSLYFAADPRFSGLHAGNQFDILEKRRNEAALDIPRMRESLVDIETFFMHRLTGSPHISPEDRKALDDAQKKLLSWTGVADHPWVLAYVTPVLIGSRVKKFRDGNVRRIEYKGVGQQVLSVKSLDGEERFLSIPTKLQLCFSRRDGKEPQPLKRDNMPVEFPVSRDFAHDIALHESKLRKRVATSVERRPENPTKEATVMTGASASGAQPRPL